MDLPTIKMNLERLRKDKTLSKAERAQLVQAQQLLAEKEGNFLELLKLNH